MSSPSVSVAVLACEAVVPPMITLARQLHLELSLKYGEYDQLAEYEDIFSP